MKTSVKISFVEICVMPFSRKYMNFCSVSMNLQVDKTIKIWKK